ncbi:MAG: glycosyltransferase family 4 protein [Deltaproteobacteria bacterium]|nr:glycosyltransferase family 4 protein [Deltaproteobacteria bacterium]
MAKIVHVMTVPESLVFLRGQVAFMREHGHELSVITSPGEGLGAFAAREKVPAYALAMPRKITPLMDLHSVASLTALLRRLRPDIVHAHTPKGGLLGMLAASAAGISARIYHQRGLPMETAQGLKRALLASTERVSCGLAHTVIAVSPSLRSLVISQGLCREDKLRVLAGGSGNGVDAAGRFAPKTVGLHARALIREELNIAHDAPVVGFIGRLVRDKGVCELAQAWATVREACPDAVLLVVGPYEPRDPVPAAIRAQLESDPRVRMTGHRKDIPQLHAAMDVLALPTYREGFPNVLLEAGAMERPVVSTRVTGCIDAVRDGVTGLLVPARDSAALADALTRYLQDPALRSEHGLAARAHVLEHFASERIWAALEATYREVLAAR